MVRIAALVCAALGAVVVGWVNLHTDEPTVVVAFAVPLAALAGALWPRAAVASGLLIGAAVPLSILLTLWLGWPTPYRCTPQMALQSCMIFAFTVPAALFGVFAVRLLAPAPTA